jgi:DNA mismatch repair protein MutS2
MPPRKRGTASSSQSRKEDIPTAIDLHGLTVDEMLPKVDSFLHNAYHARLPRILIVHGKGTGILKEEVNRYLSGHPLVRAHREADRYHGGEGATEVYLK